MTQVLGVIVTEPLDRLEGFPTPEGFSGTIRLECLEFTSRCPVTSQPDFSTIDITYHPRDLCIESKSMKLYLLGFRERGAFCEALAVEIAQRIVEDIDPSWVEVTVHQSSRGGIAIHATHSRVRDSED